MMTMHLVSGKTFNFGANYHVCGHLPCTLDEHCILCISIQSCNIKCFELKNLLFGLLQCHYSCKSSVITWVFSMFAL